MKKILSIVATALFSLASAASHASLFTQSQTLDVNGEDMLFNFNAMPAATSAGSITVAPALGSGTLGLDLSGAFPFEDENFEVTIDGGSQGFYSCGGPSNNGSTAIAGAVDNSFNFNDCNFSLSFGFTKAALDGLLADNMISVGVLFGDDVSTFGHDDIVTVSVHYSTVPEPTTVALFGLGLAGLGWSRRKKV